MTKNSEKPRRRLPPQFVPPLTPCNIVVNRCTAPRASATHRILIMRVGAFGDILMGTPLLAALRSAYPNAHLTWIVEHSQVDAINANPYIDELIVWDGSYWKRMVRLGLYLAWLARALRFQRELRARRYDVFISFQPEEWPLLLRGVGAPTAIGVFDTFRRYSRARHTSRNTRLYTHAYAHPHLPAHRIDQYLLPLDALGLPSSVPKLMSIGFTSQDRDNVQAFLQRAGCADTEKVIVLAPMTTWPSKCWPAERYAELGDLLGRRAGRKVVLVGAGRERESIAAIAAQMTAPPIVAAGDLSFRRMAALLTRAQLVVSGDTGPMHVAAAVGTPFVALFGPTSAAWYGPQDARGAALSHQKFCPNTGDDHLRCLRLITVDEAWHAAERLLAPAASAF